jgi:hypothetical protein
LTSLPRLGKLILALGIIGLLRLLPEALQASRIHRIYALVLTVDAVLAMGTAVAGEGLIRGKPWAPKLALRMAGVLLSTSVGLGAFIARTITANWSLAGVDILARMLYYVIALVFWPYGIRTLLLGAPPDARHSWKWNFIVSLLAGIPFALVVLVVFGRS